MPPVRAVNHRRDDFSVIVGCESRNFRFGGEVKLDLESVVKIFGGFSTGMQKLDARIWFSCSVLSEKKL